jgi:hypothetical protein
MSIATPRIEMAFNIGPVGAPTWTDVTHLVEAFTIERGRQHELDRIEAGTLSLTLKNDDRRFDPTFSGVLTNLVENPSFETNLAGWSDAEFPFGTMTRLTTDGASGSCCMELDAGANLYLSDYFLPAASLAVGETYAVGAALKPDIAAGEEASLQVICRDSGGSATLSTTIAAIAGPSSPGAWTRYTGTFTIPVGTDLTKVLVRVALFHPTLTVTGTLRVDAVQVEHATAATAYIDGSLDNGRWSGTVHASQSYRGGPYYPNVKPMRRVRVQGEWADATYPRFYGYIEDIEQDWQRGEFRGQAHVRASDGLLLLSMRKISGTFAQQRSDVRVGALLDAAGWAVETSVWVLDSSLLGSTTVLGPSGDRDLAEGASQVQGVTYDDEDLLSAIQDTVDAENGLFFMAADGLATFRGRNTINVAPFNQVQGTFGDDQSAASAELPYRRVRMMDDETRIWNEIRFTRVGGVEQVAEDATSQADYFERTYKRDGLLITTDSETLDAANYWLAKYKAPDQRIAGLDLEPQADDRLWPVALATEIGALERVRRRPVVDGAPGALIERTLAVGRIEERFRADGSLPGGFWEASLGLIPSDAGRFWVLDDPAGSVLGSTTVLGY